jgi:peptide/nickel transport system substrate-binding protein
MKISKHGIGRIALYAGVIGALCVPALPATSQSAAAQGNSRTINGHAVSGRFLEVWSSQGSEQNNVYVNGLPITDARQEISLTDGKTYSTQWFERARYEAHPENKAPYDVLLGLLGVTLTEGRGSLDPATKKVRNAADVPFVGIDKPADANGTSKVWFQETRHSVSGKILEYWNKYGGLKQFGFPLSEQFAEISATDGKTYQVQYFERNRFELHPEKAAPYEVELGLLGVQQYKTTPVAASDLIVAPPSGVSSKKDTLVFAMSQEPASLFFPYETAAVAGIAADPIFDSLIARDAKDNLYPEDAYYVPTVENGGAFYVGAGDDRHLVVKYKLRRGLKWSDGAPLDSNDVVYYYKLNLDPNATIADRSGFEKLSSVDNPDPYTIVTNYMSYAQARDFYNGTNDKEHFAYLKQFVDDKKPVVDALYNLWVTAILPQHILGKIPADKILESSYSRKPIGNGPFMVDRWDSGSQIVLVPNPNYTLTAPPLLKRIVIKIVTDTNQIIAQLKTGDLDAATSDAFPAPTQVLDTLASSGQTVVYQPARVWEHIDINLDMAQFKDKAVRQAMLYAINRQKIIDAVVLGKSIILNTFLPPASWASMQNPDFEKTWNSKFALADYKYDVGKANQMLDAAGWAKGGDGIRAKGGVKLSFDYKTTAGNKTREQITQLVANDFKAVGIQANLKYVPSDEYFADDGTLAKRDFGIAQYAWILGPDPAGQGQLYDSAYIPSADNNYSGQNYPGFKNDRFDTLARAANAEISHDAQAPMLAEMQKIWNDELPSLPLYPRLNIEVHKNNLVNWDVSSGTTYATYRAAAMYFK